MSYYMLMAWLQQLPIFGQSCFVNFPYYFFKSYSFTPNYLGVYI